MSKLKKTIINFIKKHNLIPKNSKIVLGLSGGPDSVFLLDFLAKLKQEGLIKDIIAAHLDHEWRQDSSKDAQFCTKITKKYNIQLIEQKLSDLKLKSKFDGSKEEFGRKARRKFFENIKKEYNYDLIALGHHAQDQQETFFIRLIRGTSLSGLTAIKPKNGPYIRPLLQINKQDIIKYLDENKIPYIIDPSNISQEFLRNRIRQQVIPALKDCDKRFDQNFQATLNRLQDTENFLEQLTQKTFDELLIQKPNTKPNIFYINLNQLFKLEKALLHRVLIYWLIAQNVKFPVSMGFLQEIIKFLQQPGSKEHQIYKNWSIIKKKNIAHIKHT